MDFTTFNGKLNKVIGKFDELVLKTAIGFSDLIADLNVKQLTEGKTEQGKSVVPKYRSKTYASAKKSIGSRAPSGTPDLKLTGDFHSSIYAKRRGDYIYTFATDPKTEMLNDKYRGIFGLTKQSANELSKEVTEKLTKTIRNELFSS